MRHSVWILNIIHHWRRLQTFNSLFNDSAFNCFDIQQEFSHVSHYCLIIIFDIFILEIQNGNISFSKLEHNVLPKLFNQCYLLLLEFIPPRWFQINILFWAACICRGRMRIVKNDFKRISHHQNNFVAFKICVHSISNWVITVDNPYTIIYHLLACSALKLIALRNRVKKKRIRASDNSSHFFELVP